MNPFIWLALGAALLGADASTTQLRQEARLALAETTDTVDLTGVWRCRLGDDPTWADPGTDDSSWTLTDFPALRDQEGKPVFEQDKPIWCRIRIYIGEVSDDLALALRLGPTLGAAEMHLNGELIDRRGQLDPELASGGRWRHSVHVMAAGLWKPKDNNVLALRLKRPHPQLPAIGRPLELGPAEPLSRDETVVGLAAVTVPGAFGLALLILGLIHLICFLLGARESQHALLATAELVAGVVLARRLFGGLDLSLLSWRGAQVDVIAVLGIALVLTLYVERSFRQLTAGWQRWAFGAASALAVAALVLPAGVALAVLPWLAGGGVVIAVGFGFFVTVQALIEGQVRAAVAIALLVIVTVGLAFDLVALLGAGRLLALVYAGAVFLFGCSVLTITEEVVGRIRAEGRAGHAQQKLRDLSSIHRFGTGINSVLDLSGFLKEVVQETAHQLGVRRCSLLLSETDATMRVKACVGLPVEVADTEVPTDSGIAGWVFTNGQPLTPERIAEIEGDTPVTESSRYLTASFICWPLSREDRNIGVLSVSDKNDGSAFSVTDEDLVSSLADRLAQVVDNALYYRRLKEENDELRGQVQPGVG